MRNVKVVMFASACCLTLAGLGGTAAAQSGGTAGYYQGFTPAPKGCPALHYLFQGSRANPVGYVWFADASGMSKATGTMDLQTGKFNLTLTSLDGTGPTGTIEGVKSPNTGIVTGELKGPGCSNAVFMPMAAR
jgi:hypothetical protein